MSQVPMRVLPRWSVVRQPLPALMAGLPACRAMVRVGPPFHAGGESRGLTTGIALLLNTTGREKQGGSLGSSHVGFGILLGRSGYSRLLPLLNKTLPQLWVLLWLTQ
jgi:hypothetical protein